MRNGLVIGARVCNCIMFSFISRLVLHRTGIGLTSTFESDQIDCRRGIQMCDSPCAIVRTRITVKNI